MILALDTETTGKADFNSGYRAEHQPRIVQLAAILLDDKLEEVMSLNCVVRPEGWDIPEEASAIHGITTEFADKVGVSIKTVLSFLGQMKRSAEIYVAHNIDFDRLIVLSEFYRAFGDGAEIPEGRCFCTMKAMVGHCKLPGNYGDYKWPKLTEAYRHAFGSEFEGAHDALADVRACVRVFQWIQSQKKEVVAA
jgi:DNA polymerase-3 subunit epsilon